MRVKGRVKNGTQGHHGCLLHRDMEYILLPHTMVAMVHRMVTMVTIEIANSPSCLKLQTKHDPRMKYMSVNARVKNWHPLLFVK